MPVGYVALDEQFRVTAANSVGAELAGSTIARMVGRVVWELYPGLENSVFGRTYKRVARTGQAETLEAYYPDPFNRWFDVRVTGDQGAVSLYFADVSERHRIQTLLEQTAAHDRSVAQTLQQAMLTALPSVPGVRIAARYLPAESTEQVGGDWYDAVVQPDGSLAVSIGDVCGHGIEAAAAMGQLRSMLRGFVWDDDGTVAGSLSRLDKAARGHGEIPLATLISGRIVGLGTDSPARLVWSNAGHPPPLLLLADGTVERVEASPELMLGVRPQTSRTDHSRLLPAGSTLILYTDGLVETPTQPFNEGIDRLALSLSRHHGAGLDEMLDRTLDELRPEHQGDDVAVLAIRLDPSPSPAWTEPPRAEVNHSLTLTADGTAPGLARSFVGSVAASLSDDLLHRAVLLTSEVVTNAVRHGEPEINLHVSVGRAGLKVSVHDEGSVLPVFGGLPEPLATGGRGLPIVDALASSWGIDPDPTSSGKAVWFALDDEAPEALVIRP